MKLHIKRPTNTLSEHHRLIWTPYMPDGEELERTEESAAEEGRPLAITHGNQVHYYLAYFYDTHLERSLNWKKLSIFLFRFLAELQTL